MNGSSHLKSAQAAPAAISAELSQESGALETTTIHHTEPHSAKRFYAPELDCLRFIAFLGVFIFHTFRTLPIDRFSPAAASIASTVGGIGAFGVDLFFVLSAYLITELLLGEKALTGKLNVRAFYIRRILRIWPLYFFFLGLASLLPLVDPSQDFGWRYLLGFSLLSGNWMIVLFGIPASVANILWSVSIEEQFYICWPPVVRKLSIRGISVIAAALLVVSNLTRLLIYVIAQPINQSLWFNTFARMNPILLGILLAVLLGTRKTIVTGLWRLLLVSVSVIALLLVSAYVHLNSNLHPASGFALIAYPAVALSCLGILLASLGLQIPLARSAGLIYLGKISYGLYVYHLLGLWLAQRLFSSFQGVAYFAICAIAALVVTITLASLSYHFIGSPFLRLKNVLHTFRRALFNARNEACVVAC